eukprot:gene22910-31214_t
MNGTSVALIMDKKGKMKIDNDIDDNDFDDGGNFDDSKETTGRWTKEEHLTFIKGLELYGKGWKKIANLVKTRTVVQIRTHAQKYFLKLAKSRQSGETSSGNIASSDGRSQRKLKRRAERSIAVAPPLQPFLKPTANLDSLRPHDIDDGLYNFLSPNFVMTVPTETGLQLHTLPTQVSGVRNDSDDRAGYKPAGGDGAPSSSSGSGSGSGAALEDMDGDGSALAPVPRLLLHSSVSRPTEWYLKAQQVSSLLKDAEELDWMEDHLECQPQVDPSRFLPVAVDFQAVPIADVDLKLKGGDSLLQESGSLCAANLSCLAQASFSFSSATRTGTDGESSGGMSDDLPFIAGMSHSNSNANAGIELLDVGPQQEEQQRYSRKRGLSDCEDRDTEGDALFF